jgi:hypothetical protein
LKEKEVILTEGSLDDIDNSVAGVNVGNNLTTAESFVGSFLQNDDLRG